MAADEHQQRDGQTPVTRHVSVRPSLERRECLRCAVTIQSPTQGWFRLLKGNALILRLLKNLQDDVQEQSVGSKCKEKTQLQKLLAIDYTR
uniref:Uncharacterized protein n=1 Tax=Zea mays TaxID=4577 RepID=A0A804M555_MAIZE